MVHKMVHNTLYLVQSTILTGLVVWITLSTKPSDVYKKLVEVEGKVLNKVGYASTIAEKVDVEINDLKIWNKEANQQLIRIQRQMDANTKWIEERTGDRWTRSDQKDWERRKFGATIEEEEKEK